MKTALSHSRYVFIVLCCLPLFINAQNLPFQWAKTNAGSSSIDFCEVQVDDSGHRYFAGKFEGLVDFEEGPAILPVQADGEGKNFIYKTDPGGNIIWIKRTNANITAFTQYHDAIYITGTFLGNVDFDPGNGTYLLNGVGFNSSQFVCKWDTAGNFSWAVSTTGYSNVPVDLTIDENNHLYVLYSNSNFNKINIKKLDSSGTILYSKELFNIIAKSIAADKNNNIVFYGRCYNTTDFNPDTTIIYTIPGNTNYSSKFICKWDSAGSFVWAKAFGGVNIDPYYFNDAINIDTAMNIYVATNFKDSADFDPDSSIYKLYTTYSSSPFIAKFDSSGKLIAAKAIQTDGINLSMTLDDTGSLLITGKFDDSTDFDPGPGTYYLQGNLNSNLYICKYDASLNFVFAKEIKTTSGIRPCDIISDSQLRIITVGYYTLATTYSNYTDFDPGNGIYPLRATGYLSSFTNVLNSNGNFISAGNLAATKMTIKDSKVDNWGIIITTGRYNGNADYDTDTATYSLLEYTAIENTYIRKVKTNGNEEWTKCFKSNSNNYSTNLAMDGANIYVCGNFSDTVDFDPGPGFNYQYTTPNVYFRGIYITKLDTYGNLLWVKIYDTQHMYIEDIDADLAGNLYLTGYFQDTVDFDPGPGVYNLIGREDNDDIFLMKLDASGNLVWVYKIGGASGDLDFRGTSVLADDAGAVYFTGDYQRLFSILPVDFDPGPGIFNYTPISSSPNYLLKLTESGNFIWVKQFEGFGPNEGGFINFSMHLGRQNELYLSSSYYRTVDCDPGPGIDTLSAPGTDYNAVILILDTAGHFVKKHLFLNFSGSSGAGALTTDTLKNIYSCVANGYSNYGLAILDSNGVMLSYHGLGNLANINDNNSMGVHIDPYNNLYWTGINNLLSFDFDFESASTFISYRMGIYDVFMAKYGNGVVGISEINPDHEESLFVYPNPSSSFIQIKSSSKPEQNTELTITDVSGQIVIQQKRYANQRLNISSLPNGIYIATLKGKESIQTGKFCVNR